MNPKRVRRLLREDNLLYLRKRKFVVIADSNHGRKVYPNLAGEMKPTGVDQLWAADITYLRLQEEFIFMAVIRDRLLAPRDRLGAGSNHGRRPDASRVTDGAGLPERPAACRAREIHGTTRPVNHS
jgi:transposase InsO family protein